MLFKIMLVLTILGFYSCGPIHKPVTKSSNILTKNNNVVEYIFNFDGDMSPVDQTAEHTLIDGYFFHDQDTNGNRYMISYAPATKGRVYMLSGYGGDENDVFAYPISRLAIMYIQLGYQVVATNSYYNGAPTATQLFSTDNGATYKSGLQPYLQSKFDYINNTYGVPNKLVISGISWGGMNTLLAACLFPEVDTYLVYVPVIVPEALSTYYGYDSKNLIDQTCINTFSQKKGYILYGTADHETMYQYAKIIIDNTVFGALTLGVEGIGLPHATTKQVVDFTTSIVGQLLD